MNDKQEAPSDRVEYALGVLDDAWSNDEITNYDTYRELHDVISEILGPEKADG